MLKRTGTALVVALLAAACGEGGNTEGGAMAMDSAMSHAPGDSMMGMGSMAGMSSAQEAPAQDADHEFLRMMSNHHEGLEVIAADMMTRAVDDSVRSAARNLHAKQAAEQDTMVAMIQRMYNEQHRPTIMPKNAAQADSLRQLSGAEADRYFLRTTIAHHEEAIQMIDRFMPRFTKPEVRQMAEQMRVDQQREIEELQGKLQSM